MQTLRKLPMSRPKTPASAAGMVLPSSIVPLRVQHHVIDRDCVLNHSFRCKPFFDRRTRVGGKACGLVGIVMQALYGGGNSRGIIGEESVRAMLDGFGEAAYAACDDGHSGRHGE